MELSQTFYFHSMHGNSQTGLVLPTALEVIPKYHSIQRDFLVHADYRL